MSLLPHCHHGAHMRYCCIATVLEPVCTYVDVALVIVEPTHGVVIMDLHMLSILEDPPLPNLPVIPRDPSLLRTKQWMMVSRMMQSDWQHQICPTPYLDLATTVALQ